MIKDFFLKKMLESQLKNIPADQREKIMGAISNNSDFFHKIAEDVQKEMSSGRNQMTAVMSVIEKHREELAKIFNEKK